MTYLSFSERMKLLEKYNFRFPRSIFVKNLDSALRAAKELGYEVVLKVVSPSISHKTDVGGIITNIKNDKELVDAVEQIKKNVSAHAPNAHILGMEVQDQLEEGGYELIVGGKVDPQFGPIVLFGMGGIFVEVFKDVSMRLAPVTRKEAKEMITEIKAYEILKGIRGKKSADLNELAEVIVKVSELMANESIKELDINPLIAYHDEVYAVDTRMVV
ncbi:MAG: acetate--CoA ligase family protein [Candidatus Diapherotrites archaeon]|nr:acetate--CoA ligase family protein [Candidatus Diapherotrites archaeon]